jgi:hypothetical protein
MRAGPMPQNYTPPANSDEVKDETLLAVINGGNLTAAQFTGLMQAVSPTVRANAMRAPEPFLEQYALLLRLEEEAVKLGLDQRQPYKNELRYNEEQILAQSLMDDHLNKTVIGPQEQRKAYEEDSGRFRFTEARVIYVSFSLTPPPRTDPNAPKVLSEQEAREKIEGILAKVRGGTDFTALVALHSEDANTRERNGSIEIYSSDQRIPEEVRKPLLATKEGEVTAPIRLANGFYLFKVERHRVRSYDEVKDQIFEELRQGQWQKWFQGVRDSIDVKIEDATAFRQVVDQVSASAAQG